MRAALGRMWGRPAGRAVLIHTTMLATALAVALGLASLVGLGVSSFGVLVLYGLGSVALTARMLRVPPVPDPDEAAMAAFAAEPLGEMLAETRDRLAAARKGVGRDAPLYRTLDRLVRCVRRIERRLALEPEMRPVLSRQLRERLPLVAATAEQHVRLSRGSPEETGRLLAAEGVLREALDSLDGLSRLEGRPDRAGIGAIRMEASAEALAERLDADMGEAAGRAAVMRAAHALRLAARAADAPFDLRLKGGASRLEDRAADPAVQALAVEGLPALEAAEEGAASAFLVQLSRL